MKETYMYIEYYTTPTNIVPSSLIELHCETQLCWTEHRLATHKHHRRDYICYMLSSVCNGF